MKLFSKLMMFMLVAALAAPFFLKGPSGRPLMTLSDLNLPSFNVSSKVSGPVETLTGEDQNAWIQWGSGKKGAPKPLQSTIDAEGKSIQAAKNTYYRWKDSEGVWQFTKQPNPNAENFLMKIDPNANIVQSLSQESIDKAFGRVKEPTLALGGIGKSEIKNPLSLESISEGGIPFPSTIPIEQVPQLIEQAKAIQDISNQRDKIVQGL
ncbi:hypothetical protein A9Q99_24555 [Gammaproteobacteria bacterium 45_16_T64]|nr:hypothetical protein A9Q99_24555 [Gammaproteobacteria bacterium 45_16_T64]